MMFIAKYKFKIAIWICRCADAKSSLFNEKDSFVSWIIYIRMPSQANRKLQLMIKRIGWLVINLNTWDWITQYRNSKRFKKVTRPYNLL